EVEVGRDERPVAAVEALLQRGRDPVVDELVERQVELQLQLLVANAAEMLLGNGARARSGEHLGGDRASRHGLEGAADDAVELERVSPRTERARTGHCGSLSVVERRDAMGRSGALADRLNGLPTYVVSTTLGDPGWNATTVLTCDFVNEVSRLKQELDGE